MKKQYKLGVIGCGGVTETILKAVVLSDFIREKKIIVSDIDEEKLDKVDYLGVRTTTDNKYAAQNSDYLIIAVAAADFSAVAKSLKGYIPEKVISVIPEMKKSAVKNALGVGMIKVARCMLNMPSAIGSGAVGIDMTDFNKDTDDTDFISNVFNRLGTVVSLDESKLDAVAGVALNGAAQTFMFIDSLIDAGVKQGLPKSEAKILAVQTVLGSAELVSREEQPLEGLLMTACNNNAAALETVKVLQDGGFNKLVGEAVEAGIKKFKEQSAK
ncbi:MAG: NAD(P)-binding domain-containing protein [Clostridia bacterium]|nr:NAD(P)-binding domain-containing protein [Clostridia bacterium]